MFDSYSVFIKAKNDYFLKHNISKILNRENIYIKDDKLSMLRPRHTKFSEIEKNYEISKSNSMFRDRIFKINKRNFKQENPPFLERRQKFSESVRKIEAQKIKEQNIDIQRRIQQQ